MAGGRHMSTHEIKQAWWTINGRTQVVYTWVLTVQFLEKCTKALEKIFHTYSQ